MVAGDSPLGRFAGGLRSSRRVALPVLGALLTALLQRAPWAAWPAFGASLSTLLVALLVVAAFDGAEAGFQLLDSADWIKKGVRDILFSEMSR